MLDHSFAKYVAWSFSSFLADGPFHVTDERTSDRVDTKVRMIAKERTGKTAWI